MESTILSLVFNTNIWNKEINMKTVQMADMDLMTSKEVLELLRISRRVLARLVAAGKIRCRAVPSHRRYLRGDVEAIVRQEQVSA